MAKLNSRHATCKICFKTTSVPISNPPFGSHLVCEHCRTPLVGRLTAEGVPESVSPQELLRAMGFSGRCLMHPLCPWCGEINCAIVAPAEGRSNPWMTEKEALNTRAFSLRTDCLYCGKEFHIEWDEAPLAPNCALCRVKMRTSDRSGVDPRFCAKCAAKLSQVRARRKNDKPPGDAVEFVLFVGFSVTPKDRQIKTLRTLDKDIGDAPIAALMLSGGVPASLVETALITVNLIETAAPKAVGHKVSLKKVTYQGYRNLLIVKIWK